MLRILRTLQKTTNLNTLNLIAIIVVSACLLIVSSLHLHSASQGDENIIFPTDAGILNVKSSPYNARGDGTNDDTAAIQRALDDNINKRKIIYFPNGIYRISNTLDWKPGKRLMLQGQNQAKTIIKLSDNAPGFTDPGKRKNVLSVFSGGKTAQAFYNYIFNLTIDVGRGNPGAVAVNFINNNIGGIRNVTLRSSDPGKVGTRGLLLTQPFPGPGLIKNLTVEGFDQGVRVGAPDYSMVFENLTLNQQRQAGLVNQDNLLAIHQLQSTNRVPAVQNIPGQGRWGMITLINANLLGGSSTHPAISNLGGEVYLRDLRTSGYTTALNQAGTNVPGTAFGEYASQPTYSIFPKTAGAQRLAIVPTPEVPWDPLQNWASVTRYGAQPDDNGDDTAGIQAAIDSGKPTIYFPQGTYRISQTIRVRGKVRRLLGLWSIMDIRDPLKKSSNPVWRFENNQQPTVIFERFQSGYLSGEVNFTALEHASPSTVVIRNVGLPGKAYRNQPGAGRLFIEDVTGAPWIFQRQQVWARQLNPEMVGTKIINRGGNLWILGLKTEEIGTVIATESGGQTEVWGGLVYPIDNVPKDQPAFRINQSKLAVSIGETAYSASSRYATFVQETRNGVTRTLEDQKFPGRTSHGKLVPLFSAS